MFLMIITPPDSHIAKFAVKKLGDALNENIQLCIYLNGIPPDQQLKIRKQVLHNPWVTIKDNYAEIAKSKASIEAQVGKAVVTASGRASELREGLYESQAEIWSTELVSFREFDLVGIVDPDFEVFEPDFIDDVLNAFGGDKALGFFSVAYSPSERVYDSYSRQHCILEERYHTWFCTYRRSALELERDFYFHEERDGDIRKWDHSAKLQELLRKTHGYSGGVLSQEQNWKFLHYGAFAQNRSLTGGKLWVYRALRIGKHNGFVHVHGSPSLSKAIQHLSNRTYRLLQLDRYDREREHYIFESQ